MYGINSYIAIVLLFVYNDNFICCAIYSSEIERNSLKSAICFTDTNQSDIIANLEYPLKIKDLESIQFALMDSNLYMFYSFDCFIYSLLPDVVSLDNVMSSVFAYTQNGSLNFETFVPVSCDSPCEPLHNGSSIIEPIFTTIVTLNQSIPVIIPVGLDNMNIIHYSNQTLQSFSRISLNESRMHYYYSLFNNTETYSNPDWVLNQGYFYLNDYYFNFNFCPYPYCRDNDDVYPSNFLDVYLIDPLTKVGCEYNLPFSFTPCINNKKRDLVCTPECPTGFSVSAYNNLLTINNNGVIIFQNSTKVGNFNWTITTIPSSSPSTEGNSVSEGVAYAGFAIGLTIYLAGIIAICYFVGRRCCCNFTSI